MFNTVVLVFGKRITSPKITVWEGCHVHLLAGSNILFFMNVTNISQFEGRRTFH
jgi:hypothetical protein